MYIIRHTHTLGNVFKIMGVFFSFSLLLPPGFNVSMMAAAEAAVFYHKVEATC